tara:strand:- start:1575 stop:2267 length:693 start_codon:yes stop_codon:yes gene_type:complete
MTRLIERNTTIPCSKCETFSTATDNQGAVDVHVLQGERDFASDNRTLGNFQLSGLPPAPRGVPQIEVAFDIDANGIVSVSAKDKATGKEQSITITGGGALSEDEIQKMVDEAAANEESDKERMSVIAGRNKLDTLVYQTSKMLDDNSTNISQETRNHIMSTMEVAKEILDSDDSGAMESAANDLESALHAASKEMYSQSQQETSENEQEDYTYQESKNDDIIDAEFEEAQ